MILPNDNNKAQILIIAPNPCHIPQKISHVIPKTIYISSSFVDGKAAFEISEVPKNINILHRMHLF